MSNRGIFTLLTLAVAGLVATEVSLSRNGAATGPAARTTLIDPVDAVDGVEIARRGEPLTRIVRENGAWRLVEPYSGGVDERRVMQLLDALALTRIDETMGDSDLLRLGRTRDDFALDDPRAQITVRSPEGDVVIAFGSATPDRAGTYAAVEGIAAVYALTNSVFAAVDLPADSFRRRALFPAGPEAVSAFDVRRGDGRQTAFDRDGDSWQVDGRHAAQPVVKAFLAEIAGAQAVDFVWPVGASNETEHASSALLAGYGLDAENALTVTLKGFDGIDRSVCFGKSAAEGFVYALVQNGSAIVTVPTALRESAAREPMLFTDTRLFPVDAKAVQVFTITEGQVSYTLSRKGDAAGALWNLDSPIVAAADSQVVDDVLSRVVALTPSDVDPEGVSVSVSTGAAIRVSAKSVLPPDGMRSLRSRQVMTVDPTLVKRLVRTPSGKDARPATVVYDRDRKEWNVPAEEGTAADAAADAEAIAAVLAALSPLNALRVERLKVSAADLDDYGLDAPYLTLSVDQDREDAVRRNLLIGARTQGGRYATVGSTDAVFVLSDGVLGKLCGRIVKEGKQ